MILIKRAEKMKSFQVYFLLACIMLINYSCNQPSPAVSRAFDPEAEKPIVDQVIHNAICWAMTKDTATLFNTFVPDSTLFIFSPDSASTLTGFNAIRYLADNADAFFLSDREVQVVVRRPPRSLKPWRSIH
jgi:hypothetical protein